MFDISCGIFSVRVFVVGTGIDDLSSNPGQGCLCFTKTLEKDMHPSFLLPAMDK